MHGKVKWFSKDKGYGFIVDNDGEDRFFGVTNIKGVELPGNGDSVDFNPANGLKGPRAENVTIRKKYLNLNDSRVTCKKCRKKMIPRIITGPPLIHGSYGWTPVPKKSICPYCANTFQEFPASLWEKIGSVVFIIFFLGFAAFVSSNIFDFNFLR